MTTRSLSLKPLSAGTRLGSFEILRLLASDGQAQVYLARVDREPRIPIQRLQSQMRWRQITPKFVAEQRLCVIKIAAPGWDQNLRDEHSYLRDPNTNHRRIVQLYPDPHESTTQRPRGQRGIWFEKFITTDGTEIELPYIALNYEPGGSLKQLLEQRKRQPLPPPVAVTIAVQAAEALQHLHTQAALVHHDISPSNIVFREPFSAWQPKQPDCVLIDLAAADSPRKPRLRQIYGKKTYLPPERLADPPQPIDWTIDVYGLGVMLYEMLVGQLPRTGTDAITRSPLPLPPIREQRPQLSEELGALVMALVTHNPARRLNLQQCISRLQQLPEARQASGLRASWQARNTWQAAASLLVLVLLLATLAGMSVIPLPLVAPATPTPVEATITPLPTATPTIVPTPTRVPTSTPSVSGQSQPTMQL